MAAAVQLMHSSGSPNDGQQALCSTAPVLDFVCLFTRDLRRKQKRWQDGRLKYHTFNKRIMVYDERGNFVGDTHWREDEDLDEGEELELERGGAIIQVAECTGSRDQDLSELIDKRAKERAERQSAALARRQSTLEAAASHTAVPHFQLRHKPLHNLIGTPTGHHGRALLPTESPYEERQKLVASPQNNDTRSIKRRRREPSPPSKGGYAQSLFGASLSLSATPTSTPLIRSKTPKIPPVFVDSQSPAAPGPRSHDGDLDSASVPMHAIDANTSEETRGRVPRTVSNQRLRAPLYSMDEPQSISSPIPGGIHLTEKHHSLANKRQLGSRKTGEIGGRIEQSDSLQSISSNMGPRGPGADALTRSQAGSKSTVRSDLSLATASRSKDAESISSDFNAKATAQIKGQSIEPRARRRVEALENGKGRQRLSQGQAIIEPRTELRIKPRKRRGLLMISEGLDTDNSSISKTNGPVNCQNPPTATVDLITRDLSDGVLDRGMSTDIEVSGNPDRSQRKKANGIESVGDVVMQDDPSKSIEPRRKRNNPDEGTISDELTGSSRSRRQLSRKKQASPSEDCPQTMVERRSNQGVSDGDDLFLPDGVPAPRLAQLGRKSIRSKEVIGFIFDEETDYSDDPPQDEGRGEHGSGSLANGLTANHSEVQSIGLVANPTDMIPANDGQVGTNNQFHSGQEIKATGTDTALKSMESHNTGAPNAEEDSYFVEERPESASVMGGKPDVQQPAKMVVNPATRGRKAAKPSDAAGKVPQCPLPTDATLGKALDNRKQEENRQKTRSEARPKKATVTPMPGFARANGGPWSREAHDLFEFTRPL